MPNASHPIELTHSQRQIWVGQRLHPASPLYNMAFAFVFDGQLDPPAFREAFRRVADASDALRTVIDLEDGAATVRLLPEGSIASHQEEFGPSPDPVAAFQAWCRHRAAQPLPAGGPLVDSVFVRLGDGRHAWYLNQHHLITDAVSTLLVYQRVAAEYAVMTGTASVPDPLPGYYATAERLVARTGRATPVASRALTAARRHWAARATPARRIVSLYGEGLAAAGTPSHRLTLTLDHQRAAAFDALCQSEGVAGPSPEASRFAGLAALTCAWLHMVGAGDTLGFDAPVAGRPTPEAKRTIGLFIEVFPFDVLVGPDASLRSLARACASEAWQFLAHARPGLSAPTAASSSPVVLNFVPGCFGPFAGLPTTVTWVHSGHGDHVHALRLQAHDFSGTGRLTLHFDFNERAWPEAGRRRALEHFERVIDAALADPDRPLATIDVRTADERTVQAEFNRALSTPRADRSVVAVFAAQAASTPDRPAVRQGDRVVSFGELAADVDAVASALAARGVTARDSVAVVCRRSVEAVVAILGTLRAGGAYVPVDPAHPAERIAALIRDAEARLVLTDGDSPINTGAVPQLSVGDATAVGRHLPRVPTWPALEDPAYLLYTSGSTGQPKGVVVEHGGLADYVDYASRTYVRGDRLVFPLFTSLSFDLTVTSLFLPLVTGGRLDVFPEGDGPVDTAVIDVVTANTADFIKLTPSHLAIVRRLDLRRSRLRRMVVGGEDLRTELAAAVSAQFGDRIEIYNEYGPTEAVVGCIVHRFDPAADRRASVPIGRPVDRIEALVLNASGTPVPDGVPAELWVAGPGVSPGYHRLPSVTADRFRPHPTRSGFRQYRTGDLVRFCAPGRLEYLGRLDRQIKLSGHRVEPGEIEAAILSGPGVDACAVVARRQRASGTPGASAPTRCARCGLEGSYPGTTFDENGLCGICRSYDAVRPFAQAYFRSMDDLQALFAESASAHRPRFDCLMLLSGGKDSTYALCRLVEMGLSVYAYSFDNGFISDHAKANMRRVADHLGVPLEFGSTPAMPAIFRDSLTRFSNVCHGCFKTIYTLGIARGHALGIPIVVTGLSRGQMFETRLTSEMFRDGRYDADEVDAAVLAARRVYHRTDDEVARSLDVTLLKDDRTFEQIRIVDFYRYCDVALDEVLAYLAEHVPWVRPADTGRSTNCLINDVGIYIHRKERGYHNYALPYSWDVRLGHKDRDAAIDELNDNLDLARVRQILAEIGYDENRLVGGDAVSLVAYYTGSARLDDVEWRRQLSARLPAALIPSRFVHVETIPLNRHGKVDEDALEREQAAGRDRPIVPADGPVEAHLVEAWQRILKTEPVSADDDFFRLGGTSLSALELMLTLCREFDIDLPLTTVFDHPTLRGLARVAEQRILDDVAGAAP